MNDMTELTDKLKAGKLEDGFYYVKLKNEKTLITSYWQDEDIDDEFFSDCNYNDVVEVLAPVPSYQEVQEMKEYLDYSIKNRYQLTEQINFWMDEHSKLKEENAKLKELLKEYRKFILDLFGLPYEFNKDVSAKDILTKINKVLK